MSTAESSTVSLRGLSVAEAQARLLSEGPNELPQSDRRTPLRIALEVLREPMLALLLGGGVVYLLLGSLEEALVLLAFATLSIFITVVQETRTERVLEALRDLTSPRALVIRDGERRRIAGREVVRGDIIVLAEGDRVPADARLLQAQDLQADESLLTGESVPVRKIAAAKTENRRPGGDDLPLVFSAALIVRGTGVAEVTATGPLSEIGKIGQSLKFVETEPPRLQAQTRRLVRIFGMLGAVVSLAAVLLYGLLRGSWLDAVLAGIALGMSMLPEEFPVVLTVFMAMGAWRISRAGVLTRRAAAIETLGSATVLCTDKTGTLTENRMRIAELRLKTGEPLVIASAAPEKLPKAFAELAAFGLLASAPEPFDPMDKAFHELGKSSSKDLKQRPEAELALIRTYGLRPNLLAITHAWRSEGGKGKFTVAAKGAPEAIAGLCHLSPRDRAAVTRNAEAMAAEGLRVLGVARATFTGKALPKTPQDFDFAFAGLVGLADPLRASVPEAIRQCQSAGIRVVMITGDYPATARAIALQAGLAVDRVVTGEEVEGLSDGDLAQAVRATTIFARIMPQQKLRIVSALKANGEIVAMTGDGVNDAPSLKAAHIGIAMGGRGTDVAREASAIVLLDDDFGSIVKAILLGRRIYDNLRKAMGFVLSVHVPIAGLALIPLLFGLPIILWPMHIAFLEMVIDPVCTLVFEAETEEKDVMRKPPRKPEEPLFSWSLIGWSFLQGTLALAIVATIFIVAHQSGMPEAEVRALAFFSLVLSIVSLIFVDRSYSSSLLEAFTRPNAALALVLIMVCTTLGLTQLWPFARELFRFGALHAGGLALTLAAATALLLLLEMLKPLWRRHMPR